MAANRQPRPTGKNNRRPARAFRHWQDTGLPPSGKLAETESTILTPPRHRHARNSAPPGTACFGPAAHARPPKPRIVVRSPPARLAESTRVLCGKYSSTLRKVQSRTPQGDSPSARHHRPVSRPLRPKSPPRCMRASIRSFLLTNRPLAAFRHTVTPLHSDAHSLAADTDDAPLPVSTAMLLATPQDSHFFNEKAMAIHSN